MKPSINLDKKDPKICLLTKILKYFDDETIKQTLARNNVHNINQMIDCIKIILMTMYYDYTNIRQNTRKQEEENKQSNK